MQQGEVLDRRSLAATLWNLDEARQRGRKADQAVTAALDWVAGRHAGGEGYIGLLCAPTLDDLDARRALPTGEDGTLGRAGVAHILGEEAVRALELWGWREGWDRDRVLPVIRAFGCGVSRPDAGHPPAGMFCCLRCSVARWRAIAAARPPDWEDILHDGLRALEQRPLTAGGIWPRFPFYYTLLALAEMPLPEVGTERRRVLPAAERRLARGTGDDRPGRFRRRALEWAVSG